jgi:isopentenyl-diphosphate delta-isomerase
MTMESEKPKLWFRAKRYGWGWYPVSWEGWLIIAIFVAVLTLHALLSVSETVEPTNNEIYWFFVRTSILVFLLIYICYRRGEKPRWRWGDTSATEFTKIYTAEGEPTGSVATLREVHQKGLWHQTVHVWVVTPDKKILMQKRAKIKTAGADEWDNHGGHIEKDEDPTTAAVREVKEEIGLTLAPSSLKQCLRYQKSQSYNGGTFVENEYIILYIAEATVELAALKLNYEEVSEVGLFSVSELSVGKAPDGCIIGLNAQEYQALLAYITGEHHGAA